MVFGYQSFNLNFRQFGVKVPVRTIDDERNDDKWTPEDVERGAATKSVSDTSVLFNR